MAAGDDVAARRQEVARSVGAARANAEAVIAAELDAGGGSHMYSAMLMDGDGEEVRGRGGSRRRIGGAGRRDRP